MQMFDISIPLDIYQIQEKKKKKKNIAKLVAKLGWVKKLL